jgi:hypothetical protein
MSDRRRSPAFGLGALALLFSFRALAQHQSSASAEGHVGAAIVMGLSVQKSQDLILGEFRPGLVPGTVELDVLESSTATARSATGGVALAGAAFSAAEFSVSAHAGAPVHFAVGLPAAITIQRVGGGEVMRVDRFRSNVRQDCVRGAPPASCPGSPYTLFVGATVHVDSGQPAGRYVGTFTVTVNQL